MKLRKYCVNRVAATGPVFWPERAAREKKATLSFLPSLIFSDLTAGLYA